MIVDDSEVALSYLEGRLHACGLRSRRAATSAAALEVLARQRADIVFIDLDLGDASELDGLGLCRLLKRQGTESSATAPVVLVSAHTGQAHRVRGMLAGCDAFLPKPVGFDALRRLLGEHGLLPQPVATA